MKLWPLLFLLLPWSAACSTADEAIPPDWITVTAGAAFTLHAPPGTVFAPLRGEDSFVGTFKHPAFKIGFDYGLYSNDLSKLRSDPRFATSTASVDGRSAIIVTGRSDGAWGCRDHLAAMYVGGVHESGSGRIRLEIHGCTADPAYVPALVKMFRSVRFPARNRR